METLPAVLCIFIVAYIIYLEIKNPNKNRDLFVDLSISIIIMLVGIYSMYEYKFDFSKLVVKLYIVLLIMSIGYILLVVNNDKKIKNNSKNEENIILTDDDLSHDELVNSEEQGDSNVD